MLKIEEEGATEIPAERAEETERRSAPPDKVTRYLSVLSLSVAGLSFILSFVGLYFSALRPAKLQISIGTRVLVNYYRKIGVLCTFTNDGANQIVITSASLKWRVPPTDFTLGEVSPTLETWRYTRDEKGNNKKETTPTSYTMFSPIAVQQKDQATAILWFTAPVGFRFTQGRQTFTVEARSNSTKVAETDIGIELSEDNIKFIEEYKDNEMPINIIGQQQK
jgi:hypothetical protein